MSREYEKIVGDEQAAAFFARERREGFDILKAFSTAEAAEGEGEVDGDAYDDSVVQRSGFFVEADPKVFSSGITKRMQPWPCVGSTTSTVVVLAPDLVS